MSIMRLLGTPTAWRRLLGGAVMLGLLAAGGGLHQASAQGAPKASEEGSSPPANIGPPVTLRLTQVTPRLPTIHMFAIAQDQNNAPVPLQASWLRALVGSNSYPVQVQKSNGIAIIFLVDISRSLNHQQFSLIKAAVLAWIGSLGPDDRAAIVTLGSEVRTVQDFTADKQALSKAMNGLEPRDNNTLLYQGLVESIDMSRRTDPGLPLRRAIVTLTDGMDDQTGGAGLKEVQDKLSLDPTPIYGIGASAVNNAKVDAALKDFSGLVRKSGGDFRRITLRTLNQAYFELRHIVANTTYVTATCPPADCKPDGNSAVVRLTLADGTERLTSDSVTVSLVGADGKIVKQPPPPPVQPAPAARPVAPPVAPPHPTGGFWSWLARLKLNIPINIVLKAPLQFGVGLAILLLGGGFLAARTTLNRPRRISVPPETVKPEPAPVMFGVMAVSGRVAVPTGTQRDKRRLRLYPLGHNELKPFDVLFQDRLTLGRAPESDICINNDTQVSAKHCTLSPEGRLILVQDDGSRNGTRINGVPVSSTLHAESDSILGVGRTEMRMRLLEAEA